MSLTFIAAAWQAPLAFSGDRNWANDGRLAVIADFDQDGRTDWAALLDDDGITLLLSRQQTAIRLTALPDTTGFAATDIDGDGDTDLVSLGGQDEIRGWNNQGGGSYVHWTTGPARERPLKRPASVGGSVISSSAPVEPAIFVRGSPTDTWFVSPRLVSALRRSAIGLHLRSDRPPDSLASAGDSPRAPPSSFSF